MGARCREVKALRSGWPAAAGPYAYGQFNTDREPVDDRFEPSPGVHVFIGDSLFTASKAANLPAVIGASPLGTLLTLPHRHMLIALPITGPETVAAVEHLVACDR